MVKYEGHAINEIFHMKDIGDDIVGANAHYIVSEVQISDKIFFKSCSFSMNVEEAKNKLNLPKV